jgi:hypothetical protein
MPEGMRHCVSEVALRPQAIRSCVS